MSFTITKAVIGKGNPSQALSTSELQAIVEEALQDVAPGERVLAIIPDRTRDDNTDLLFPMAAQFLAQRNVTELDALVAQGTHPPMTDEQKRLKIGAGVSELPGLGRVLDHQWDRSDQLVRLGELSASQVNKLTDGLINESVAIRLNALLAPGIYDTVLVFGATMPHEVAGFAGGAKYFFPGVAGPELTHMTHWLVFFLMIGRPPRSTLFPTRRVIEAAAVLVSPRIISFTSVST